MRRDQQQRRHRQGADHPGQLGLGASRLGHRRARGAAADGKALEQSGGQVGGAQADHFLVGVDLGLGARGVGARQHAGVGEGDDGDRAAAEHHGGDVDAAEPGQDEAGQPLGQVAQHLDAELVQVEEANQHGREDHHDENAGQLLEGFEQQDQRQAAAADGKAVPVGLASGDGLDQMPQIEQGAFALDGDAEQLGHLGDQHDQGDAVHVAVADRLGQQLGDEAQAQQADDDANHAGYHRHHAGQGDRAHRVAAGEWQHHGEDRRGERRIRAEHQNAAGAEQRIGQQRNDGGIQAVDARHPGRLGVGDADRHQHGGQHQAGGQILGQPLGAILSEHQQARQPAQPGGGGARAGRAVGRWWLGLHGRSSSSRAGAGSESRVAGSQEEG
ncbi:hypothetical protein D3C78_976580 [compost metagenome]